MQMMQCRTVFAHIAFLVLTMYNAGSQRKGELLNSSRWFDEFWDILRKHAFPTHMVFFTLPTST